MESYAIARGWLTDESREARADGDQTPVKGQSLPMRIAVLGAGSWGTALAILLAEAGHEVLLWARDPDAANDLAACRENRRYLPGRRFPAAVAVTGVIAEAATGVGMAVLALPSAHLRAV